MDSQAPRTMKREVTEDLLCKPQAHIAFSDVTVCFSKEDWLHLQVWEKELYKKVIGEIHGALISMGYSIANPSVVFRIKSEEEEQCFTGCLDSNLKENSAVIQQSSILKASISLRARKVCKPSCQDKELPEKRESQSTSESTPGHPIFHPKLALWIKEVEEPCGSNEHQADVLSPSPAEGSLTVKTEDKYAIKCAEQQKEFESLLKTTKENVQQFADGGSSFCKPSQSRRKWGNPTRDGLSALPDSEPGRGVFESPVVRKAVIQEHKPFKCKECGKSFDKNSNLIIHQRTHTGEKPYKCALCEKSFSHKSNLNQHQRTHTGERPFQCTFCEKRFSHKVSRNLHQRTHTGERPYRCSVCAKCFRRNSHLIQHMKTHSADRRRGKKRDMNHDSNGSWQVSQGPFQETRLDMDYLLKPTE